MVVMMLANIIAGISPVEDAKKTTSTVYRSAAVCPTDATAISSMSVRITRGTNVINATNMASVQPGDVVKVTFDLNDACLNYRVSLVSYKAPDTSNNLDTLPLRVVSSTSTNLFGATGGSLQVTVPPCYFATVFTVGSIITTMSASNLYGSRQMDT